MLLLVIAAGCVGMQKLEQAEQLAAPQVMVYKTKADYFNKVPVLLSEDHQSILSYPDPKDLLQNGQLLLPTRLAEGYLLDNKGIGVHTAFLDLSYREYAALISAPKPTDLWERIIDKDPFTELYECGPRSGYKRAWALNKLIKSNFKGAMKIK